MRATAQLSAVAKASPYLAVYYGGRCSAICHHSVLGSQLAQESHRMLLSLQQVLAYWAVNATGS